MTIPTEHTIVTGGRMRAGALLGAGPDAGPDDRRRAALAQLDHADYDPPAAWHDAIALLFGPEELRLDPEDDQNAAFQVSKPALRDEMERQLGDEIEKFAARFFDIDPIERTRIWKALRQRGEFSGMLSRRPELLAPGLNVVAPRHDSLGQDGQSLLIRWIIGGFPLRMRNRAAIWMLACDVMRNSPENWSVAADQLRRDNREIARLAPDLVAEASLLQVQQRRRTQQIKVRQRALKRNKWTRWRSKVIGNGKIPGWVTAMVVISVLRVAGTTLSRVDVSEKPNSQRSSERFREIVRRSEVPAKANYTAEQGAARSSGQGRNSGPEVPIVLSQAADFMPDALRADVKARLRTNRRLTVEQSEWLERFLKDIHHGDALRQLRDYQGPPRRKLEIVRAMGSDLIFAGADAFEWETTDSQPPIPDPPDLPSEPES